MVERCTCPTQFPMIRVSEGKYRIGDTKVLIFVRILRSHVMVRVGGGWDTLSHYLDKHDPCRCRTCKWIFQYFSRNLFTFYLLFFFSYYSFPFFFFFLFDGANRETYKKIWDNGDSLNKDELIVVENKDDDRRLSEILLRVTSLLKMDCSFFIFFVVANLRTVRFVFVLKKYDDSRSFFFFFLSKINSKIDDLIGLNFKLTTSGKYLRFFDRKIFLLLTYNFNLILFIFWILSQLRFFIKYFFECFL